jgi:CRP-like cAMP-binding protein
VQSTLTEARAIVHTSPTDPGPLSTVTFDLLFGGGIDDIPECGHRRFEPGRYIAHRGDVPNKIFVISNGIAMIGTFDAGSSEFAGRVLVHSEVVGLVEMLAAHPLTYDVTASTRCEVLTITRSSLMQHLATHPETRSRVIRLLADFVRDADRMLKRL